MTEWCKLDDGRFMLTFIHLGHRVMLVFGGKK